MKKIEQKATELQLDLLWFQSTRIESLSTELQTLAEQIKKGQEQDDFIEMDLRRWKEKLNNLKSNFTSSTTIIINQDDNIPLVHNISLSYLSVEKNELFDRVSNNDVRIEEDGTVVASVKIFMTYSERRGKNSYEFGCHKICLQVEHESTKWMFLGINSKSTLLQNRSFSSKSAFGWCNSNCIYSNGSLQSNKTNPPIEMNKNDIITLIFDCDNRKISMINERTKIKYELTVDINNCPFPWQLHVIFQSMNRRIRILSA